MKKPRKRVDLRAVPSDSSHVRKRASREMATAAGAESVPVQSATEVDEAALLSSEAAVSGLPDIRNW